MTVAVDYAATNADALHLIRALAVAAGDPARVSGVLLALLDEVGEARSVNVSLAALRITYAECMSGPSTLDPTSPPIPARIP